MQTLTRDTLQTEPLQIAAPSINDDITTALNRDDFKKWLLRLGTLAAGESNEPERCPIACYLNLTTGHAVRAYGRVIGCDEGETVLAPEWVRLFVIGVDMHRGFYPISAAECLEILDAISA